MTRLLTWLWKRQVIGTFLAGLFVILPIVITVAVMAWVGGILRTWLGAESFVGRALASLGAKFVADPLALVFGWILVLGAIWVLGLLVRTAGKNRIERMIHTVFEQVPIVSSLYRPVVQVIEMIKKGGRSDLQGMSVVYCHFGEHHGGGFLSLLVSPEKYLLGGQECYAVYVPTSPIPMSGGIVFVPTKKVQPVDMSVEDLMQIYFSIGVMSSKVIPNKYRVTKQPNS